MKLLEECAWDCVILIFSMYDEEDEEEEFKQGRNFELNE